MMDYHVEPAADALVLPTGDARDREIRVQIRPDARPAVDVYVLADTTGSMQPALDAMAQGAADLVTGLGKALPYVDLRFGVGEYRDFPSDVFAFRNLLGPSADLPSIERAVSSWTAGGGYDGPEGTLYALDRLAHDDDGHGGWIGWRPEARHVVVWFGDAPAHDPVCAAVSGLPADLHEATVTKALADAGVAVISIATTTGRAGGLDGDPAADAWSYRGKCPIEGKSGQASRIALATGGRAIDGVPPEGLVKTIASEVIGQLGTVRSVSLVPSKELAPLVTVSPATTGPVDVSKVSGVTFDLAWKGGAACDADTRTVKGTIDAYADGQLVGWQDVVVTVPGCPQEVAGGGGSGLRKASTLK